MTRHHSVQRLLGGLTHHRARTHRKILSHVVIILAGATRLKPAAYCVTGSRSNQLNYAPVFTDFLPLPRVLFRAMDSQNFPRISW
jgi:hypothetical protein